MNSAQSRPSPLLGAVVAGLVLYGGWYVTRHEPAWYDWGLAAMGLGVAILLVKLVELLTSFFASAYQIDRLTESRRLSFTYGSARLAREEDAFVCKLAQTKGGFFIGMLRKTPLFYDPFARGNGHMLTYAPSRTGKTICVVIPALMHWFGGSIVTTDVKGELVAHTAAWRRARGQRVLILDPFNITGLGGLRFNPLRVLVDDVLKNGGKELAGLARLITFQLIGERAHEVGDGKFFRSGGRRLIACLMLYLAVFEPVRCHLPGLRAVVWASNDDKRVIAARMQGVPLFGGLVQEYGNALADMLAPEYAKTFGAFRDNAMEALEIYEAHSDFGKAAMASDFSLRDVLDGKTTLYLVLPEARLETHGNWMGLVTTLLFEAIALCDQPTRTMMLLEEMGNLGRIPNIKKALSLLPGRGLRCWMILQSRRQPVEIYGPETAGIIEEQASLVQAWSIRAEEDRKAWSARIGTTTKKARSVSRDPHDQSAPWRLSVGERAAPVLAPDEIGRMPESCQLVALDGAPVIVATKVPYYRVAAWRKAARQGSLRPRPQASAEGTS